MELAQEARHLLARHAGAAEVPTPAGVLREAINVCEELHQAREAAQLRPSVARQLNERIRLLEGELEELRGAKKVDQLEKKIAFLEGELRQSYATKNYTLRSSLLELEKRYRDHIEADAAVAALWGDVAHLLAANDKAHEERRMRYSSGSGVGAGGAPTGAAGAAAGAGAGGALLLSASVLKSPRLSETSGGVSDDASAAPHAEAGAPAGAGGIGSVLSRWRSRIGGAADAEGDATPTTATTAGSSSHRGEGLRSERSAFAGVMREWAAMEASAAQHAQAQAAQTARRAHAAPSGRPAAARGGATAADSEGSPANDGLQSVQSESGDASSQAAGSGPLGQGLAEAAAATTAGGEGGAAAAAAAAAAAGVGAAAPMAAAVPALSALVADFMMHVRAEGADANGGDAGSQGQQVVPALAPDELEAALQRFLAADRDQLPRLAATLAAVAPRGPSSSGGRGQVPLGTPPRPGQRGTRVQAAQQALQQQQQRQEGGPSETPFAHQQDYDGAPRPHQQQQPSLRPDGASAALVPGGEDVAALNAAPRLPPLPIPSPDTASARAASGIVYGGSGGELPVAKVAVGQSLDLLSALGAEGAASGNGGGGPEAGLSAAGMEALNAAVVRPEDLPDLEAAAREINSLRASSMQLAAQLSVSQSLVAHLNGAMKTAIEKADDGDAEVGELIRQLDEARRELGSISQEKAELTRLLVDAKVDLASSKSALSRVLKDLRRVLSQETSAVAKVVELEAMLASLPPDPEASPMSRGMRLVSAGAALFGGRRGAAATGVSPASVAAAAATEAPEAAAASQAAPTSTGVSGTAGNSSSGSGSGGAGATYGGDGGAARVGILAGFRRVAGPTPNPAAPPGRPFV